MRRIGPFSNQPVVRADDCHIRYVMVRDRGCGLSSLVRPLSKAMETINIRSHSQTEFVDITDQVQDAVKKLEVSDGVCYVYVPHTTAAVTINENADPTVRQDIIMALDRIVARELPYRHGEGNSPAHIKGSLIGSSVTVLVEGGRLVLGTWQGIFFCEFDGPRNRRVCVKGLEHGVYPA